MSRFTAVNIGQEPNDHQGDKLRPAFAKINANFAQADQDLAATETILTATTITAQNALALAQVNDVTHSVVDWAATLEIDMSGTKLQTIVITANTQIALLNPEPPDDDHLRSVTLRLVSDGSGDHTIGFLDSDIKWFGLGAPSTLFDTKTLMISLTSFGETTADVHAIPIYQS